jgi:hypothetical protein
MPVTRADQEIRVALSLVFAAQAGHKMIAKANSSTTPLPTAMPTTDMVVSLIS